jgi:peptidoglycan hydrolase-like protein with peptidoglycan-binding domain
VLGVDYSAGPPSPVKLREHGFVFAARYVSSPGNPKNLTRAEAVGLRRAGVDIVVVFETYAKRPLAGSGAGHADGVAARSQAEAAGAPPNSAIYAACDFDVTSSAQLRTVAGYFDGFRTGLGPHPAGGYGEYDVVNALLVGRHVTYGWQTAAWSRGRLLRSAHLYQRAQTVKIDGVSCDVDVALQAHFGSWATGAIHVPGGRPNPHRAPTRVISFPPPARGAGPVTRIRIGGRPRVVQHGADVAWVQWGAGMPGREIDGIAGPATHDAIDEFQGHHHDMHGRPLHRDGVAGPLTRWALAQVRR